MIQFLAFLILGLILIGIVSMLISGQYDSLLATIRNALPIPQRGGG